MKYYRNGRAYEESTRKTDHDEAARELKLREGAIAKGAKVTPAIGRLTFDAAAADVLNDYRVNRRRSYAKDETRIRLGLAPAFSGRRLATITTPDVRAYAAARLEAGAAPATINRELAALKRMFVLAVQAEKLIARPHIPMLAERNVRKGFFERADLEAVCAHLSADVAPVVRFCLSHRLAHRVGSLTARVAQVDWVGQGVRLDPDTTRTTRAACSR
jgi:hypothetical protein